MLVSTFVVACCLSTPKLASSRFPIETVPKTTPASIELFAVLSLCWDITFVSCVLKLGLIL